MHVVFKVEPIFDKAGEPIFQGVLPAAASRADYAKWALNHALGREVTREGFSVLRFELQEEGRPSADFVMGGASGGIWSERAVSALKHFLEPCGDLHPTGVFGKFGQYFHFDCWERIKVQANDGYSIFAPQTLRTLEVPFYPLPPIFVGTPTIVGKVVSQEFKDAFVNEGLIGAEFYPAECIVLPAPQDCCQQNDATKPGA